VNRRDKSSLAWLLSANVQGAYHTGAASARLVAFASDRRVGILVLPLERRLKVYGWRMALSARNQLQGRITTGIMLKK